VYLRDTIACRRCHGLDHASNHLRRRTRGVGRVERLRRKLGDCEPKPFAPLPVCIRRDRSRAYHDKLVAMILDEETALLGVKSGFDLVGACLPGADAARSVLQPLAVLDQGETACPSTGLRPGRTPLNQHTRGDGVTSSPFPIQYYCA
jgi:hypothetical protein